MSRTKARCWLSLLVTALLAARCSETESRPPPRAENGDSAASTARELGPVTDAQFVWVPVADHWSHQSDASGEYRLPEMVSGGVVLFDLDGDLDLDVFLVQAGPWLDLHPDAPTPGHLLLRNDGPWKFTDVSEAAGIRGAPDQYGMGVTAADYDNDGDQDLYVTAVETNTLFQNNGDGTFQDVTAAAGVGGDSRWSASACWFDADRDGWLDLYVVNYLEYSHELNRNNICGVATTGVRDYCSPRVFAGVEDFYFHNQGDGRFVEKAADVGLQTPQPLSRHGKGLGVVATDVDSDGDVDLYVANDSTANFLFLNDGSGQFEESGLIAGCAFSEDGEGQAGMGTEAADFDVDGDMDLWVVHLDLETNALYVNDGTGFFADENRNAGLSPPSRGQVGFGTDFFDFDHDRDLDLIVANGHVMLHVGETRGTANYRQVDQLFTNLGDGTFELVPVALAGEYFARRNASRGLATGDLDNDGDLDVVIAVKDEPPVFLCNQQAEHDGGARSVILKLTGDPCNRDAIGSRVTLRAGSRWQMEEVRGGSSYASRHDLRLHFGLGEAASADVEIRWPGGTVLKLGNLRPGYSYQIHQQDGVIGRTRLTLP